MEESASTQEQREILRGQDVRARSCAALVFAFHAGLPPLPVGTAARLPAPSPRTRRMPRLVLPTAPIEVDEPSDDAPARTAYEILKWVGMIAAIAAPWVLLLSG